MQNQYKDWLIAAITLGVGVTATVVVPSGKVGSALLGSTTGAVIGAVVLNKRHEADRKKLGDQVLRKEESQKQLEAQVLKQEEWETLKAEFPRLKATVNQLIQEKTDLAKISGKFTQRQEEYRALKIMIANLTPQKQDLEQQVAVRNSKLVWVNGQLVHQESELQELNHQHEQARQKLETLFQQQGVATERFSTLQAELVFITAQLSALNPEVERLKEQKRSLVNVEAQLAVKQAEFAQLEMQVQATSANSQELAQKSASLELLRATYDGLFSERQSIENRIRELNPEITRLEAEKKQIEQAIETQVTEYANSLQLLQEINELKRTKNRLRREQNEQEAENNHLKDESLHLTQTLSELQEKIRIVQSNLGDTNLRVENALQALKQSPWQESELLRFQCSNPLDEQSFIDNFIQYIKDLGFNFPERVIRAFHTSLKVQDISALIVLAGISGTGKSELPQLYAKCIGALPLVLAVQPRWDSPQDLLGFYNYIEEKFKPTPLIRGIYQYNHSTSLREQDRMVIVLLDEMNLARVEYYFSEFLVLLEARRNNDAYLDIDLGSLPLTDEERRYKIPKQFLFVGTMNEDETTQTLSDKVLDRANVLTFGKPEQLVLGSQGSNPNEPLEYLTYSQFRNWSKSTATNPAVVKKVSEVLNQANKVMEEMGHPFAHRVYQAITQYVVNYPGVDDEKSSAFKAALADQFGQKFLPKLRGIMTDDEHVKPNLRQLGEIIASIGDEALKIAFDKACRGYQFQWKGLVYPGS